MRELEIVRHPQIDGLHIFVDTVDYRTPHVHRELELVWILDGSLAVQNSSTPCKIRQGEMLLIGPNQTHEFHCTGKSCTFLCLQVAPKLLSNASFPLESISWKSALPKEMMTNEKYTLVQRRILEMARQYLKRSSQYELFCVGQSYLLLYDLLAALPHQVLSADALAERDKRNDRLRRLIEFVDENYMNRIRLLDFAQREGLSMSYLSHFVKQTLHQSFQEYVNTVRFNAACKMIASGSTKMLDVCIASGFSDYRYFSRTFQKRVGVTPELYSRQVIMPVPEETQIHHSLHSLERFYSREKSLELLNAFASGLGL